MKKMKELYEKVAKDSTLRTKFEEIMKNVADAGPEKTGEELTAFAKEAGYEVSVEEMQEFFKILSAEVEGTLSDMELDMVAGGKSEPYIPPNSVDMTITECAVVSIRDKLITHGCEMYITL